LTTYKEISDDYEDLRAQLDQGGLQELVSINNVIEKMMVGLIPLKCRIVDYVVTETAFGMRVMHRRALDALDPENRPSTRSLYLVGDTEQSLYWKDIRRVLFTGSRFRMLCRLNRDGVVTNWSPLKLANTLKKIDPYLGDKLASFGTWAVAAMAGSSAMPTGLTQQRIQSMLSYAQMLAVSAGHDFSVGELKEISSLAQSKVGAFTSALALREAFEPICELVERYTSTSFDREIAARIRQSACEDNNLNLDGSPLTSEQAVFTDTPSTPLDMIDVEVVAIYW
jgi:hypothetical protein